MSYALPESGNLLRLWPAGAGPADAALRVEHVDVTGILVGHENLLTGLSRQDGVSHGYEISVMLTGWSRLCDFPRSDEGVDKMFRDVLTQDRLHDLRIRELLLEDFLARGGEVVILGAFDLEIVLCHFVTQVCRVDSENGHLGLFDHVQQIHSLARQSFTSDVWKVQRLVRPEVRWRRFKQSSLGSGEHVEIVHTTVGEILLDGVHPCSSGDTVEVEIPQLLWQVEVLQRENRLVFLFRCSDWSFFKPKRLRDLKKHVLFRHDLLHGLAKVSKKPSTSSELHVCALTPALQHVVSNRQGK